MLSCDVFDEKNRMKNKVELGHFNMHKSESANLEKLGLE